MPQNWQAPRKKCIKKVNANYGSLLQQSYEEIIIVTQV